MNSNSLQTGTIYLERSLATYLPYDKFQFEPQGYFVANGVDHVAGKLVFNFAEGVEGFLSDMN